MTDACSCLATSFLGRQGGRAWPSLGLERSLFGSVCGKDCGVRREAPPRRPGQLGGGEAGAQGTAVEEEQTGRAQRRLDGGQGRVRANKSTLCKTRHRRQRGPWPLHPQGLTQASAGGSCPGGPGTASGHPGVSGSGSHALGWRDGTHIHSPSMQR